MTMTNLHRRCHRTAWEVCNDRDAVYALRIPGVSREGNLLFMSISLGIFLITTQLAAAFRCGWAYCIARSWALLEYQGQAVRYDMNGAICEHRDFTL